MIEETLYEARSVEWNELMQHAIRQALFCERGGGHRSRCHEHGETLCTEPFDKRHSCEHLADACGMNPNKRALRALEARLAEPLRHALGMFLAALETPRQHLRCDRRAE